MLAHKGKMKLRPVHAHVKREGILDKVKPFLKIEGHNHEWKSEHKHGHNVEWGHEGHWEHHLHPNDEIHMKLMDHEGLLNNEPIGHWNGSLKEFMHESHTIEREFEFMHMGHCAAVVRMHIHFERD